MKIIDVDMSLLINVKEGINGPYITIPISEHILEKIVKTKQIKGVTNLNVQLVGNTIVVRGAVRKFRMKMHFQIHLQPLEAKNRQLAFKIVRMKPVNQDWITNLVLSKFQFLRYYKGIIYLDMNQLEKAKSIRVGNVKHVEVKNEKLWVGVGL